MLKKIDLNVQKSTIFFVCSKGTFQNIFNPPKQNHFKTWAITQAPPAKTQGQNAKMLFPKITNGGHLFVVNTIHLPAIVTVPICG